MWKKYNAQPGGPSTIFNDFGMSRAGIEPVTSTYWAIGAGLYFLT